MKPLTEEQKADLTIRIEKILGKPPHNMITEVIVKELVEKYEALEAEILKLGGM